MVKLMDITRGLPQRIEGQFRRSWSFAPALWNLYFRERVNLGASLSIKRGQQHQEKSAEILETDAAMAAADLLQKLEKGSYRLPDNRRRMINNRLPCLALLRIRPVIILGRAVRVVRLVSLVWVVKLSCSRRSQCSNTSTGAARSTTMRASCSLQWA